MEVPNISKGDQPMTSKQKLFADTYLANGFKAKAAYLEVYGPKNNPDPTYPYKLLKIPEVAEYINSKRQDLYESLSIDAKRVMGEIANIAFNEGKVPLGVKLKALELLSKNLNIASDTEEKDDVIEVKIVEE